MNSRMDKYDSNVDTKGRTQRNQKLYEDVQDINIDYIDIDVNNAFEIKDKRPEGQRASREEFHRLRELDGVLNNAEVKVEEKTKIEVTEERVYDINEILKQAKENKLFQTDEKKRLINTEYNILTKLDVDDFNTRTDLNKENLRDLIDTIYSKEEAKEAKQEAKGEKELLDNLMEDDTLPQESEQEQEEIQKEENVEAPEQTEETVIEITDEIEKSFSDTAPFIESPVKDKIMNFFVIILVITILGLVAYLLLKYFGII